MDYSRKFCFILEANDLTPANIGQTAKVIEHNPDNFYLLASNCNVKLCNLIDDLSEVISRKSVISKIRIAYNLNFNLQTILKVGDTFSATGTEVKNLADLLDKLEFDEHFSLAKTDYHVIINDDNVKKSVDGTDDASKAVAKLFQQMIFLNISIDIQKKSELQMAIMKNRFRKNYPELYRQIESQEKFLTQVLQNSALNESGKVRVRDMLEAVKTTKAELLKARQRPIRIAAMGTKKAGKSVVINSLLHRDYAPTSLTMPTPNTIKYIPSDINQPLTLEYNGDKQTFDSPEELKKYINEEFKKAQGKSGKGSALPDMTIHYPCDDLNGYEIWDTPGPDFAGAGDEHRKNAEACIKAVDICIFVMDYTKHLTDGEVEFLKQIHEFFRSENKFYSLFITANKTDERYASEDQKSIVRVLDYIGGRLEQLNYKNIVLFGTSALQHFYLEKVIELAKAEGAKNFPIITGDNLANLEDKYLDVDDIIMTQIDFISSAIDKLRRFHGIKDATEKEIETFSGMPQLSQYAKYIGEQKADLEIVNNVVGNCEGQFAIIKNNLSVVEYQTLSEEAKKYLRDVAVRIDEVEKMASELKTRSLISAEELRETHKTVKRQNGSLRAYAHNNFKDRVKFLINNRAVTEKEIREFADSEFKNSHFNSDLMVGVNNIFDSIKTQSTDNMRRNVKIVLLEMKEKIEKAINTEKQKIIAKVAEINKTLKKAGVPEIQMPDFPISVSLNVPNITTSGGVYSGTIIKIAGDSIQEVEREGFFGWIADIFTTKTVVNIQQFKDTIVSKVSAEGAKKINKVFDNISEQSTDEIDKNFDNFIKICSETGATYQKIFKQTLYDINIVLDETGKKKAELDRNIAILQNIDRSFQPFFAIWKDVRGEQK